MQDTEKLIKGLQIIVTELSQQADGHVIESRPLGAAGFTKLREKYAEHAEEARDDYTAFDILKEYYRDEEEDMYRGEQQLELIDRIGVQNRLLGHM